MKNNLNKWIFALFCSLTLICFTNIAQAKCFWIPGHWHHGFWIPGHWRCHHHHHKNCHWVPGHWHNGHWVPGYRICWH